MRLEDRQWAGLFLLVGTTQFAIGMIIAEAVDPSYSVSTNYISDLGVRAGAVIFNTSIILLGITILATSWLLLRAFKDPILMIPVLLAGVGAVGVGVFTEAFGFLHTIVSFITFLFAGLSAILAFLILRPPLSYVSLFLGFGSLAALGLLILNNCLGIVTGGVERGTVSPAPTIGALLPLTGGLSFFGTDMAKAIQLLDEQVNGSGGVRGSNLTVHVVDSQTDPVAARNGATTLIQQKGVQAIVGGVS